MAALDGKPVVCDLRGCNEPLPLGARKYCSKKHQNTAARRRARAKAKGAVSVDAEPKRSAQPGRAEVTNDGRVSAREAPDWFVEGGWYEAIDDGTMTMGQVAVRTNTTSANVSRWFEWMKRRRLLAQAADGWERPPEAVRALEDFAYFRARYFTVARGVFRGQPYKTQPFHQKWIDAILDALPEEMGGNGDPNRGGQQVILSPPRIGKTDLLVHACIWLILRNPDIAIIWIAKAQARANEVGRMIHGELERNEKLAADFLGPGGSFKPATRAGLGAWRDDEFSVATRTAVQKSPTFRAFGRGGTLQSVDADVIVGDDVEDHESTRTPDQRSKNLDWLMTEVESRKEPHTAWVMIGSRNHPQDVLDHLLQSEDWNAIVETAHALDCELPVADEAAHVDCMLWPEKFPYSELAKKVRNSGEAIVAMRYLNNPKSDSLSVFSEEAIRNCLDRSRVLGKRGLADLPKGQGYELLGSIDPSPGVHQIVELWAWSRTNPVRYLIDMPKIRGGMDAWEDVVKRWLADYGCRRWVVESNGLQSDYVNRREFVQWRSENGVHVVGSATGRNKHAAGIGVASMHPLYVNKQIVLPYGDGDTQGPIDAFIREHVGYDPDRTQQRTNWRIDRVMTAWFAHKYIDTLTGGRAQAQVEDSTPDWLTPDGLGWVDSDASFNGWL